MKEIFKEKTEGSISGAELKAIILEAARDSENGENGCDSEAALYFYKAAAEIDVNSRYIKKTTDVYYMREGQ